MHITLRAVSRAVVVAVISRCAKSRILSQCFSSFRKLIAVTFVGAASIGAAHAQNIASTAPASCIWYADANTLYQVATDTNTVAKTVSLKAAHSLAMNGSDCGVWAVSEKQLYRFDAAANQTFKLALKSLSKPLDDTSRLAVDPLDNSVWLSDDKTLVHMNANGQQLGSVNTAGNIKGIVVELDQTVWVLGGQQIWHYSAQGVLIASQDLNKLLRADPKYLAFDSLGQALWVAGGKQLIQINLDQAGKAALQIDLPDNANALTLNARTGELWVATDKALLSFGWDGKPVHAFDLSANNLKNVRPFAFDQSTQSLWAAADRILARLNSQGVLIATLLAKDGEAALAVPGFIMTPTLQLIRPRANTVTNNPKPTISYGFGALCNNQTCGLAPDSFRDYTLTATVNQTPIGPFVFDAITGQASFAPDTRLPEGQNTLVAQATDSFGHASNITSDVFTIDTIPPKFLNVAPAEGLVVIVPSVTIQGAVDDTTASIVLSGMGLSTSANTAVSGNNLNFNYPVTLTTGLNTFTLTAWDPANNSASTVLHLTYSPLITTALAILAGPTDTTASVTVTINQNGTGYYLVQAAASAAPTPAAVVAAGHSVAMTAGTPASINLSGLTPSTAYKLYFVAKDMYNNLQAAVSDGLAITTTATPDPTPDAFAFIDQTNVALTTVATSTPITVTGINVPAPISIVGGSYSINGGTFTATAGTVTAGQTVAVRLTASASYSTTTSAVLNIGGVTDSFDVTTISDTTPDAFTFADQTNVALSTVATSAPITVTGINAPAPISIVGGTYSINGGAFTTTAGTVSLGQTVAVRLTASASYSTTTSAVLNIGGVTDSFDVTTLAFIPRTNPDPFSFADQTGAPLSTVTTSAPVTITGINVPSPISIVGGTYSINGGAYTAASGTVTAGQTVAVRLTSSASYSSLSSAALNVGGATDSFDVTTVAAPVDTTPDPFSIAAQSGVALSSAIISAPVTITGINAAAPVTITGGSFSINGGAYATTGNVTNGQTITVRLVSSASFSTTVSAILNVGGVTGNFNVTTLAQAVQPPAVAFYINGQENGNISLSTGTPFTLSYASLNATSCTLSGTYNGNQWFGPVSYGLNYDWGLVDGSGYGPGTFQWNVICSNAAGDTASASATLTMTPSLAPAVTFYINGQPNGNITLLSGTSYTLSYASQNTTSCTLNTTFNGGYWYGPVSPGVNFDWGVVDGTSYGPGTYQWNVTCSDSTGNTASASASLTMVLPAGYVSQGGLIWMPAMFDLTWSAANAYCQTTLINGLTGWRLPTGPELYALYLSGAMIGQGWNDTFIWSSEPLGINTYVAYDMTTGGGLGLPDASFVSMGVTCVGN